MIDLDGVVKRWGARSALDGVTASIGRGVTGLLGANGAGKTTLLGLFLGLHRADAGIVRVLGHDPASAGALVRERVGYAPEHHNLPPDVRAYDLVAHMAEVHGLPRRQATTRASDALYLVGLGEERLRPVGTMSTGQRQRVKLAAALAHDPALLLLDEPTDGLDPVQRDGMLALIRDIGTRLGIDVVLSSHLLDEVERICDAAVIIGDGRVLAAGSLDALRGGDTGWDVQLDGTAPAELLAATLAGRGVMARADGTWVRVDAPGDARAVRDVCAHLGLAVIRLRPRRRSLEDVFLASAGGAPVVGGNPS